MSLHRRDKMSSQVESIQVPSKKRALVKTKSGSIEDVITRSKGKSVSKRLNFGGGEGMNDFRNLQTPPIFTIRHRFVTNFVDLNISLFSNGKINLSNGTFILSIEAHEFFVVVESISNGCSFSGSNISCEIFLDTGVKTMRIQRQGIVLTFPFIQDSLKKLVKVVSSINLHRLHIEKEVIKNDIETCVIYSLFSLRLRMNMIHEQLCPGCNNNNNNSKDESRHFCGVEVVGFKLVSQSRIRACEDVVKYHCNLDETTKMIELKNQIEKLYFIYNIHDEYKMCTGKELKAKIQAICLLRDESRLCEILEFDVAKVVYDRFFFRDVEIYAFQTFPSKNSLCEFGN